MGERSGLRARVADGFVAVTPPDDTIAVRDPDEMIALIQRSRPPTIVVGATHPGARDLIERLETLPLRERPLSVVLVHDLDAVPAGAHVVVHDAVLDQALVLFDRVGAVDLHRPLALHQMLDTSILGGSIDEALERASEQLAAAFGVDRCVISIRGDSIGGAASGDHTWDSVAWSATAQYCRVAAASRSTLVVPSADGRTSCESYLAVPLANNGFVALVVTGPRAFSRQYLTTLKAVANRLDAEIGWRTAHQRAVDELERQASSPGVDRLLGIWNRVAMSQLAAMQVSAARRSDVALVAIVVDVVNLAGVNTRYGHEAGDRVLRRIADAIRVSVRIEDVVGRWGGDEVAVILHATSVDGAQRVAERFHAAFASRPVELANGDVLPIEVNVGVAALQPTEDADAFVARAAWAAKRSEARISVARASTGPAPRLSDAELRVELSPSFGGAYRVLHEISRGGMGVVYHAEDLALERPVAIKMLRPDLAEDTNFVEGLRKEAAILARLQHPNLVQIYNFGQSAGDSYFVMELVEGEGLQQAFNRHRLEDTAMPLAELVTTTDQIASALDALHERGVVHRDIKPANIIRDPFRNRSVLVDVGIARRYGQFVEGAGTPGYCAPEVILGGEATARSDVYGLAATVYTMLALALPWGDGDNVLARQAGGEVVPLLSTLRPDLVALDPLIASALAWDPRERPASAGAFARALRAAIAPLVAPARDETRWNGQIVVPTRARGLAQTRGVVFRSVTRALGVHDGERLRDAIGGVHPALASALTDAAPLAWLPTELLTALLELAPEHVGRDRAQLARDIARAAVRASFRRFFPASAATLVPERTLSAIRSVWARYQSWGNVTSMPVRANETVIRISSTLANPELCAWTSGMIEQLVTLSGAHRPSVDHEGCEARGDDACLFRVMWSEERARTA